MRITPDCPGGTPNGAGALRSATGAMRIWSLIALGIAVSLTGCGTLDRLSRGWARSDHDADLGPNQRSEMAADLHADAGRPAFAERGELAVAVWVPRFLQGPARGSGG